MEGVSSMHPALGVQAGEAAIGQVVDQRNYDIRFLGDAVLTEEGTKSESISNQLECINQNQEGQWPNLKE